MTPRKTIELIVVVLVIVSITLSLTIPAPALYPLAAVFGLLEAGMTLGNMLDD